MRADDQRANKKDAVFDTIKILKTNQIPITTTLDRILPLRGSLIGFQSGNNNLYYGNGIQWVQITNGDIFIRGPLSDVLAAGNVTGGNDIEITDGDLILSQLDGAIRLSSSGSASLININSQGQILLESDRSDLSAIVLRCNDTSGGVLIESGSAGVDIESVLGQISLTSTQAEADAVQINALNGGIDINAGDDGVDINTSGQLNMTSFAFGGGNTVNITASSQPISISTNGGTTFTNTKTLIGTRDSINISTNQNNIPTASIGTVAENSTDTAGSVTEWGRAVSSSCTITFNVPKTTYSVVITPRNAGTVNNRLYISDSGTSSFTVSCRNNAPAGLAFNYLVIGYE